jgi:hypothetical protein
LYALIKIKTTRLISHTIRLVLTPPVFMTKKNKIKLATPRTSRIFKKNTFKLCSGRYLFIRFMIPHCEEIPFNDNP